MSAKVRQMAIPIALAAGMAGYFLSGAIFIVALFAGACCLVYRVTPAEDRGLVVRVLVAGFLVRVFLAVALHGYFYLKGFHSTSGDDLLYTIRGLTLLWRWEGMPDGWAQEITSTLPEYGVNPYTVILAVFYKVFGFHPVAAKLINCAIGALTGWISYRLGMELFGRQAARIALVLTVFYPSLIRWSVANLRDPLLVLLLTGLFLLLVIALIRRIALYWLGALGVCMVLLHWIQPLACALTAAGGCFVFVVRIFRAVRRRLNAVLSSGVIRKGCIIFLVGAGMLSLWYLASVHMTKFVDYFYLLEERQTAVALTDDAGYRIYTREFMEGLNEGRVDAFQLACVVSRGVSYFMLTPFPWRIVSRSQLIALPQIIMWYCLLFLSFFGFVQLFASRPGVAFLIGFYLGAGIILSSLAEGNIGSAFRHRDMFTPFIIVLASGPIPYLRPHRTSGRIGSP